MLKLPIRCLAPKLPRAFSLSLMSASLLLTAALPAGAGTLYRWVTDDGVVSYTDEERRIPERYRARAEQQPRSELRDYARLTPADPHASADYAAQLSARLERLRSAQHQATRAEAQATQAARTRVTLRAGEESRPTLELDVSGASEEPVVVEVRRLLDTDTMATRHVTVVRQGDRVLSVVDPRKHREAPSSGTLQELLEARR